MEWQYHQMKDCTWELREMMEQAYPPFIQFVTILGMKCFIWGELSHSYFTYLVLVMPSIHLP